MSGVHTVGRVLFLNTDGGVQFTAHYNTPSTLRDSELSTIHGVFRQNHQTNSGQHAYKYERPLVGPPDIYITDYRYPADADWDGPRAARKTATWEMVNAKFEELTVTGCTTPDLIALHLLAHAAFHKLPIPDPTVVLEQAIPDVVITQPPVFKRLTDKWHDFDGGIREPEATLDKVSNERT